MWYDTQPIKSKFICFTSVPPCSVVYSVSCKLLYPLPFLTNRLEGILFMEAMRKGKQNMSHMTAIRLLYQSTTPCLCIEINLSNLCMTQTNEYHL